MEFKKYQHIERIGTQEVEGIELGICHIFPKIDGTNSQVYLDEHQNICCGSRNRQLSLDNDNAGFMRYVYEGEQNANIRTYLDNHPNHRLFGEFLVSHSLKTYRDDAWRKFYIFDIVEEVENDLISYRHIPYDEYKPLLEEYELDYIPCIAVIKNPSYENLIQKLEQNTFLIQNGKGIGEGIVIKNYDFFNVYGRQTWGKIVTSEFKEKHVKEMGGSISNGPVMIEEKIIEEYCTSALIEKIYSKIKIEEDGWSSKMIPRLLSSVYHDVVVEESWNIVKKMKNPTINFKTLQGMLTRKIKEVKPELF